MTLLILHIDPELKDSQRAKKLIRHTIEKLNQENRILDSDEERLIIDCVDKFNLGEYLIPDLEVEINSLFAA